MRFPCFHCLCLPQQLNGLSEESTTDPLEFPLLTQRSVSSISQLLPFLRTLCCSFQDQPPYSHLMSHFPVADYPAASADGVLKKLEQITEDEFLDSFQGVRGHTQSIASSVQTDANY